MEFNNIVYDVADGIAVVTINRPKTMNSLNSETVTEISQVFDIIAADDAVLGVIVTGSGNKAFVAGADISELATKDTMSGRDFALSGQLALSKIERLPKPVIAAVNGFALGGGCELCMACHLRTAAAHAKFGQPEVNLGLIPGFGGTQRLPRLVGRGIALELLLGANVIGASEAYRIGLVNRVIEAYKKDDDGNDLTDEKGRKIFDRDAFLGETKEMLNVMLSKGPIALSFVIDAVNRGLDTDIEAGMRLEADLFGVLYVAEDTSEGLNAFLEKRKANFTGK